MTEIMKKVKFQPIGDRVLVKRLEAEEKVQGIILPDSAKKKQETAEVVAMGSGRKLSSGEVEKLEGVSVGDVVLLDKYSGQEISVDEEEYVIVKFSDVIAVVQD